MKTVAQLKTEIRDSIWASGEPENLVSAHNDAFQEGFADIAKWVECEQVNNVNVVRFASTQYKNGMTVLKAPAGVVTRIFTVANDNFGDPVFYRQVEWPVPEAWARNLFLFPADLVNLPRLPLGFQYPSADNDSLYGRARTGIWAFHQGNIYIAPWVQSNELVIVEWDGIKQLWEENDPVNEDILYKKAVKLYVQYAHERDYGDANRAITFKNTVSYNGTYDEALADLIHECRERRKTRPAPEVGSYERNRLCSELSDDVVLPPLTTVTLADVGNISAPGEDADDVAKLVEGFSADGILACGLIAGAVTDYDLTAGKEFHRFINPYGGTQGPGAQGNNAFWPAPSTTDWTKDNTVTWQAFFRTGGHGSYYDVVLGDIHLFVIDSSASNPDGNTAGSTQALWLQARLALSTAPWKIVKMDLCPWGSVHSNAALQWPFTAWGADLVICSQARNYERLFTANTNIINNGLGGLGAIEKIPAPYVGTLASYAGGFGAGKIRANATQLLYEFITVDEEVIDSFQLDK
jgi:hypothetical protein